jgi:hypothetical protein
MKDKILLLILLLAFSLRILGIGYGLPLMVVGDEPPFVLAALKMIELRTVIPAMNEEAFRAILYYPPYISYLYLPFFVIAIGAQWLMWQGSSELFPSYLLSDLSIFFEIGRVIMVMLGVASIYLVYKTALSLYRSRLAALLAAFLLATSGLHIALSIVGRHWLPVSFLFAFILFLLTRENFSPRKKLILSLLVIGAGAGVSTAAFLLVIPVFLWFLIMEASSIKKLLKDKLLWGAGIAALVLTALPSLLFRGAGGALEGGFSLLQEKSFVEILISPAKALILIVGTEPVLIGLFCIGLVLLWFLNKHLALFSLLFFISYVVAFYFLFLFQPRFMLPLFPLFAIVAPAALVFLKRYHATPIVLALLLIPLLVSTRISYLAYQDDSRAVAREWMLREALPTDKIIVYGNLLRLKAEAEGIAALRAIDSVAVRRVDIADEALDSKEHPLVLNISNVQNNEFFAALPEYAKAQGYNYAVIEEGYGGETRRPMIQSLLKNATEIARFRGLGPTLSISESDLSGKLSELFSDKSFGPTVVIYRLR